MDGFSFNILICITLIDVYYINKFVLYREVSIVLKGFQPLS